MFILWWARTIGSCVYSVFSTLIPMALEIVVNATGQLWQFITLVFAIILGLGLATLALSLLHYKAIDNAEVYIGTQSAAFDK